MGLIGIGSLPEQCLNRKVILALSRVDERGLSVGYRPSEDNPSHECNKDRSLKSHGSRFLF